MAKAYEMTPGNRRFNAILVALLRRGLPLGGFYLLTVEGRKTGQLYRLPVTPIRHDGQWWLVSPYGEVNWVRNARAAGRVTLTRGRTQRTFRLRELAPAESAPILREYLMRFSIVRPYFDAGPQSPLEALSAEAPRHPVFQLIAPAPALAGRRRAFLWVRTILNPLAKVILRSPLHGAMSGRLMLITFTGRSSGKQYTTPISYVQQGQTLLLGVGGPWWKNLRGGVPVQVRLRGKTYAGRAEAWSDEASMARVYRSILAENPTQARFMGITAGSDGQPDSHDIQQALQRGAAVVDVQLAPLS